MKQDEVKNELLKAIDEAIAKGNWESSLFFKNMLKQLQELRGYVDSELTQEAEEAARKAQAISLIPTSIFEGKEGYIKVYIAIYQAEGEQLEKWVNTIKSIGEYYVSRPVYKVEEHVQEMIRSKRSRADGYVVAWIKQNDVLPPANGMQLTDRFGHELLTLKGGGMTPDNVSEFVHDNKRYYLQESQLILKNASLPNEQQKI